MADPTTWRPAPLGVLLLEALAASPEELASGVLVAVAAEMMAAAASDSKLSAALWAIAVWVLKKAATLLVPPATALLRSAVIADHPWMEWYLLSRRLSMEEIAPEASDQFDSTAAVALLT
jgi:hypothetical protein